MVVIAVIGVLLGVVIISLGTAHDSALSTRDLSNQKQIAKADISFAVDHRGKLLHPRTIDEDPDSGTHVNDDARKRFWVRDDWANTYQVPDTPTGLEALKQGAAWEYIGNADVYLSPLDPTQRLRSYSLNSFLGVNNGADDYAGYAGNPPPNLGMNYVPCSSISIVPQPSRTLCVINEDDIEYANNWNGFLVHPGWGNTVIAQWIDIPAWQWNPGRINLAYMDGSTDTYQVTDYEDLVENVDQHGVIYQNVDYMFFKDIMLPGRLEN